MAALETERLSAVYNKPWRNPKHTVLDFSSSTKLLCFGQ